jgi:hypothetical protein
MYKKFETDYQIDSSKALTRSSATLSQGREGIRGWRFAPAGLPAFAGMTSIQSMGLKKKGAAAFRPSRPL